MGESSTHERVFGHCTAIFRNQWRAWLLPWLAILMGWLPSSASAETSADLNLLMAGTTCPDAALGSQLEKELTRHGQTWISHTRVAAALARVRAERALVKARDLFRRTDFDGCIALLSITEQELGRNLADHDAALLRRAHLLLARINLWLGICQWAAGDPQTASGSFVRAAQLPDNPAPDPRLLPPELVEAHRAALSAPRQDVSCRLLPPLRPEYILVDGRTPDLDGEHFRIAAGTHYVTLQPNCGAADTSCRLALQALGGHGRSLRLEASELRCRVQVPSRLAASHVTCASTSEVAEATFIATLTGETRASRTISVSLESRRLLAHLYRQGAAGFGRQIAAELQANDVPAKELARMVDMLLGVDTSPVSAPYHKPWYRDWWVWTVIGVAVVGVTVTTSVIVSQQQHLYRLRF